jgi:hypothetical protein
MNNNFEQSQKRYIDTWNLENHDRPLLALYAPKDKQSRSNLKHPEKIEDRWLDTEYVIKLNKLLVENTYFGGDALPIYNPNLGPDILGAIMGCELGYGEGTSWANHFVEDFANFPDLKFDAENKYYKKIMELTKAALDDSKGDYFVGITDLHAGLDGLVSLRGPENMCFDLIECPNEIKKFTWQVFDIFKKVYNASNNLISKYQHGTVNWMGVWHPEKWYVTSCDFSCLISNNDFKEFILPELLEEIKFLDASIYHLDGPDALRHLDTLLEIPELKGIQWVPGAGQKPMREWVDVIKKIQNAGKIAQLFIETDDIKPLFEAIRPEGMILSCSCKNEQEAKDILKFTEEFYKK